MKFQKVNKKSKLDVIQSKMGLLRIKLSSGFTQQSKMGLLRVKLSSGFTQKWVY